MYSQEYLEWIKQRKDKVGLTNNQHRFCEFLFKEDSIKEIRKLGNFDGLFVEIRKYLRNNPEIGEEK